MGSAEMTSKKPKRPKDTNQLAKSIVDIASGEAADHSEELSNAGARGQTGGIKGGPARAKKLTPEQRTHIAKVAASARWKSKKD